MSDRSETSSRQHVVAAVLRERARQRLREYGTVLVFRDERRQEGATWWRPSRGAPPEDPVTVEHLTTVTPRPGALGSYVVESGYRSAIGWSGVIHQRFGEVPMSGHLYRISTLSVDEVPGELIEQYHREASASEVQHG